MSDDRAANIRSFVERASAVLDQVDYYRLLSISSASDNETVRAAYYKLAASLHPDVHGVDVNTEYRAKLTAVFSLDFARCSRFGVLVQIAIGDWSRCCLKRIRSKVPVYTDRMRTTKPSAFDHRLLAQSTSRRIHRQ